jgi:hypothetical protein
METLATLGLMLGTSWATGINLYAVVFVLGLTHRLGWIDLPSSLDPLSSMVVLVTAGLFYVIEFVADKIPAVDSVWDTIHTFIRPLGGAALAYMAVGDTAPIFQVMAALLGGTVALNSHLTKATSRVAINTSPEPFSNWTASLAGDGLVLALLWLAIMHPVIALFVVIAFVLVSLWFLARMVKFLRSVFTFAGSETPAAGR